MKRRDIRHCNECNTCSEFYDHHCGVVQVCICGANMKFFLLTIFYAAMIFASFAIAMTLFINSLNNHILKDHYREEVSFPIVGGTIFAIVFFGFSCIFSGELVNPRQDAPFDVQLAVEYPDFHGSRAGRACHKFCGSSWNVLVWLIPI